MEDHEITAVLLQASELHAKINDAIERALKSEFLLSTGGGAGTWEAASDEEEENHLVRGGGEGNVEARSLGSIRDALESLEEQLECLQALQQQQRLEKNEVLAELEEVRRTLLSRLKQHKGKESEVIREALAFAGAPVEELYLPDAAEVSGVTQDDGEEEEYSTPQRIKHHTKVTSSMKLFGFPVELKNVGSIAGRILRPGTMVLASVITILLFSELGSRRKTSPTNSAREERCPTGKISVLQDGIPKCVVKERTEVPFVRELKTPNVLYGRG